MKELEVFGKSWGKSLKKIYGRDIFLSKEKCRMDAKKKKNYYNFIEIITVTITILIFF